MELVDFSTIISDIKLNQFYCNLPSLIKILTNKKMDDKSDQNTSKKRKTLSEPKSPKIVSNDIIEKDWKLRDGENWNSWQHKVGGAPVLSCNPRPCLKYQVCGSCFNYCTNRTSHKKLSCNDFRLTDEFIKCTQSEME